MATYNTFEDLDCYKKCRKLRIYIYHFLKEKNINDRDIRQNILRAGRSMTRNIAEGFGGHHSKENIQFCRIARGSIFEILEDLQIIVDEEFCLESEISLGKSLCWKSIKSLNGYIFYLKQSLKKQ